jgi:predicted outer membrane repeat protein
VAWRRAAALIIIGAALPAFAGELIRVPDDVPNLSVAIDEIDDGGVIEMASGTYAAPSGGFIISNPNKSFTIRPVPGASVTLSGSGSRPVVRFINSMPDTDSTVVFEDLVFADGYSTLDGAAGGVTLEGAAATFVRCSFRDNQSQANVTGGGGTAVFLGSVAHFTDCEWRENIARNEGAGLRVGEGSAAYVHRGRFIANLANPPGHRGTATGGGLHVTDSVVWVTNSRFEGNQAGYAGGGAYALGTWQAPYTTPRAELVLANCTFVGNRSERHPSVPAVGPTEGGAINVEDQTRATVTNSRLIDNSADLGGCMSVYRSEVEIVDSVFLGNQAVGVGQSTGFGGCFKVSAADLPGESVNFPSADFVLADSFVQCRYGSTGAAAQVAAGLWAGGDICRAYGIGGCSTGGTLGFNRTVAALDGVVFADCDADWGGISQQGLAGAISSSLVDFDLTDSLVVACDATGDGSSGGAMRIVFQSDARVAGTTIADNTAGDYGGAIYASGSALSFEDLQFFDNEFSPGSSEPETESFGAAIFAAPFDGSFGTASDLPVTGRLSSSVLSNNVGMPLFDDDRNPQPINAVDYVNNQFYNTTFGTRIYRHSIAQSKTPSELNSLVIAHSGVDKGSGNAGLSSAPVLGSLLAAPSRVLPVTAAGDGEPSTVSYLGYAWDGGGATLDGVPVSGGRGWGPTTAGNHTLTVAGTPFQATVGTGPAPSAQLTASPEIISSGQLVTLSWSTQAGTFSGAFIDHGVGRRSTSSGQAQVFPTATTTYRLHVATEEGGATSEVTVWVDELPSGLFADGFESGDASAWSSTVGD